MVDFARVRLRTRNLIGVMRQASTGLIGADSTDQLDREIRARKNTSQLVALGRVKTKVGFGSGCWLLLLKCSL